MPAVPLFAMTARAADRLAFDQALTLYRDGSLNDLAARAAQAARRLHGDRVRTYVIERNINYTNVCLCRCRFCAFSVSPGDPRAYVLTPDQIAAKVEPLLALGGTQVLLQGGFHPDLPLAWYEDLLADLKDRFPDLHLHAFSPPEIVFLARRFELPVPRLLERLRSAGLDSLPGGGAEILVDRVRRLVSPAKCSADEWLDVMRHAHRLGIYTTATMMFGHLETLAERLTHLDRLRRLQDESLCCRDQDPSRGCFTAFCAWPFQPGNTALVREAPPTDCPAQTERPAPAPSASRPPARPVLAGAYECLRLVALARLYLDNLPNIQSPWVTEGPKIGQLALHFGCNDFGSLMMEENVVAAAGATSRLPLRQLRHLIRLAGFVPVQRDYYYRWLEPPTPPFFQETPPP